ncbi:RING finger protein 212B [Liparis tanakae]|uniref:RING finger protein 212B n=1 Tax=Liparis tanakae TaxID=230148 RepID=A0A4Z2GLS0_9TELE|nr:RING finger protein 212B [Liparis tanakae]
MYTVNDGLMGFNCYGGRIARDTRFSLRHSNRKGTRSVLAEQCSVCGASCSYLPITDEVGEFDISTMKPQEKVFFKDPMKLIQSRLDHISQIALFQRTQAERVTAHFKHKSVELERRLKEVTEQGYSYFGSAESQGLARDRGPSLSSLTTPGSATSMSSHSSLHEYVHTGVRAVDVAEGAFETRSGVCEGLALADWADFFDVLMLFESGLLGEAGGGGGLPGGEEQGEVFNTSDGSCGTSGSILQVLVSCKGSSSLCSSSFKLSPSPESSSVPSYTSASMTLSPKASKLLDKKWERLDLLILFNSSVLRVVLGCGEAPPANPQLVAAVAEPLANVVTTQPSFFLQTPQLCFRGPVLLQKALSEGGELRFRLLVAPVAVLSRGRLREVEGNVGRRARRRFRWGAVEIGILRGWEGGAETRGDPQSLKMSVASSQRQMPQERPVEGENELH